MMLLGQPIMFFGGDGDGGGGVNDDNGDGVLMNV